MQSNQNEYDSNSEMNEIKYRLDKVRKQLFSDDITMSKNRLWVFENKLSDHDTFIDFGYLVSMEISDYDVILKEYGSNVSNKLLKLVSDFMFEYLNERHLKFEIVRYSQDNFLLFFQDMDETEVKMHMSTMQQSMLHYKFKHRHKMFNLAFYFAVMQYVKNESFSTVLDQLDEELFLNQP